MKLRFLTIVAVVLIAFYAGLLVDASRTTGDAISIPKTFEIVPTNAPESGRVTEATFFFAESRPDPVLEAPVGHPLPHQRPQVLRRLQLRRARRQRVQPHVGRHLQRLGHVPAGVVHQHDQDLLAPGVGPPREFGQRLAHQFGVRLGQEQAPVAARGRPGEAVDVQRLESLPPATRGAAAAG